MQFKDAAYEILKQAGKPLHYNEITDRALKAGILETSGQTPHASMGALLYTDTLKPNSRFRRGDQKGSFALQIAPPSDIQQQISIIDSKVRDTIHRRLLNMHPQKFESLIQSLLDEMGLQETSITTYGGDGGIDVRGVLNAEDLSQINVAIQAKRWKGNVSASVVRELRGSLKVHEHGIIITPSDFTPSAKAEADEPGKVHISLIGGEQLIDLLVQHQVGVKKEQYSIPVLDQEYWVEFLGEDSEQFEFEKPLAPEVKKPLIKVKFPLPIEVEHKGQVYKAEMLDLKGKIEYAGQMFETPSAAAKAVATEWKAVNGWEFWTYLDPITKTWKKIKSLKES